MSRAAECPRRGRHGYDVELRGFRGTWDVLVYRSSVEPEYVAVKVVHRGPDSRDRRVVGSFGVTDRYWAPPRRGPPTAARVARWVRETMLRHLAHELDECLYVGGGPARAPHPGDRKGRGRK